LTNRSHLEKDENTRKRADFSGVQSIVWNGNTSVPPFGSSVNSLTVISETIVLATPFSIYFLPARAGSLSQLKALTSEVRTVPYVVRGTSPGDLVVVGDEQSIFHYNGVRWQALHRGAFGEPIYGLAVSRQMILGVGDAGGALIVESLH
jgi:hypothetical protein